MKAIVNATLVTCAGPPGVRTGEELQDPFVVRDGAMLIDDAGRIAELDYTSEIRARLRPGDEEIDAGGKAVLPGFVDAHSHPVFIASRVDEFEMRTRGATYQEIGAAGGGIKSSVRRVREASEADLLRETRRHLDWMLACGTTTLEGKSGYGLDLANEAKMLRVLRKLGEEGPQRIVPTFLGAHAIPEGQTTEQCCNILVQQMLPAVVEDGLAEYCDIFCESGYFDAASARLILGRAKELGLGLRMHVDQLTDGGGAMLAAELGARTADHLEQTGIEGIQALADAGVQPVLLPGSVFALGLSKYPIAREMISRGLAVVLATDFNPGSSPTPSIPMVMSLTCTQMKMTPAEALLASTINAAHSLGRGNIVGSLEPGKRADFVIWDTDDYREIAYYFGRQMALRIFIGGKEVGSSSGKTTS